MIQMFFFFDILGLNGLNSKLHKRHKNSNSTFPRRFGDPFGKQGHLYRILKGGLIPLVTPAVQNVLKETDYANFATDFLSLTIP